MATMKIILAPIRLIYESNRLGLEIVQTIACDRCNFITFTHHSCRYQSISVQISEMNAKYNIVKVMNPDRTKLSDNGADFEYPYSSSKHLFQLPCDPSRILSVTLIREATPRVTLTSAQAKNQLQEVLVFDAYNPVCS